MNERLYETKPKKVENEAVTIHPTAHVHPKVVLESGVSVGPHSVIGEHVHVGARTEIGSSVFLDGWTTIGEDCSIYHGAVIGTAPQDVTYTGVLTRCVVGSRNIIREYATIHRASKEGQVTTIGDDNYIMAYAHVAHDCKMGNCVVLANASQMAGYSVIEDYAVVSGLVPIHQFVRIGAHSIVGGGCRVPKDIVPYALAAGYPIRIAGLNHVGLTRRNFPAETRRILKHAFRYLFRQSLNTTQALDLIRSELPQIPEIVRLLEFVEKSQRGIVK